MKYLFSIVVLLIPSVLLANPMVGTFKGTEKSTVTNCNYSQYNGTTSGSWEVTNTLIEGDRFKGQGKNVSGSFSAEGSVSGNKATGTTKGTNKWGQAWTGEFAGTIDGDTYTSSGKGNVPASGCDFVVEVKATRQ